MPELTADMQSRLEAIWPDAYRAAWDAVAPERDRLQDEVKQLTKDTHAYVADLHGAEQTEQTQRDELDQANQRATTAEPNARTDVKQAQCEAAEMRGRSDQLATKNARLAELIGEQLTEFIDDKQERHWHPRKNQT